MYPFLSFSPCSGATRRGQPIGESSPALMEVAQANSLSSVAAATDNDVWAVGWAYNQSLGAYRTLTEHWNGTRWSLVRSPNATSGYNLLNGVAAVAANDIWTVGQAAIGSTYNTLVEHWNGVAWSIVPSPNIAGNSNVLEAISVVSAEQHLGGWVLNR